MTCPYVLFTSRGLYPFVWDYVQTDIDVNYKACLQKVIYLCSLLLPAFLFKVFRIIRTESSRLFCIWEHCMLDKVLFSLNSLCTFGVQHAEKKTVYYT